jgi:hypothetical protein
MAREKANKFFRETHIDEVEMQALSAVQWQVDRLSVLIPNLSQIVRDSLHQHMEHLRSAGASDGTGRRTGYGQAVQPRPSSEARSVQAEFSGQGGKRGPKTGYEDAARAAGIVARLAPEGDWEKKLDEICEALDAEKVPCPKTWHAKDRTCTCWADKIERPIVIKALKHRLGLARQPRKPTPETLA